jgi:hypothetical protein
VAGWGKEREFVCVQCRGLIADGLARLGSVLCHGCREEQRVDAVLVRSAPKRALTTRRSQLARRRGRQAEVGRSRDDDERERFEAGEEPGESEPSEPPTPDVP